MGDLLGSPRVAPLFLPLISHFATFFFLFFFFISAPFDFGYFARAPIRSKAHATCAAIVHFLPLISHFTTFLFLFPLLLISATLLVHQFGLRLMRRARRLYTAGIYIKTSKRLALGLGALGLCSTR